MRLLSKSLPKRIGKEGNEFLMCYVCAMCNKLYLHRCLQKVKKGRKREHPESENPLTRSCICSKITFGELIQYPFNLEGFLGRTKKNWKTSTVMSLGKVSKNRFKTFILCYCVTTTKVKKRSKKKKSRRVGIFVLKEKETNVFV